MLGLYISRMIFFHVIFELRSSLHNQALYTLCDAVRNIPLLHTSLLLFLSVSTSLPLCLYLCCTHHSSFLSCMAYMPAFLSASPLGENGPERISTETSKSVLGVPDQVSAKSNPDVRLKNLT